MEVNQLGNGYTLLRVRLTPRGGRNSLTSWENAVLNARVAVPPVDGAANRALTELLSRSLDIPKSRIHIEKGNTSREKTVRIEGVESNELSILLLNLLSSQKTK